jgi:hypothetical protein
VRLQVEVEYAVEAGLIHYGTFKNGRESIGQPRHVDADGFNPASCIAQVVAETRSRLSQRHLPWLLGIGHQAGSLFQRCDFDPILGRSQFVDRQLLRLAVEAEPEAILQQGL